MAIFRKPMDLIDIGANLAGSSFDNDRHEVLTRARAAGVSTLIVTSSDAAETEGVLHLAKSYPGNIYGTAGVHPHHAAGFNADTVDSLRRLCREPEIVAVGECGLDFFRNYSPRDAQESAFERQLELALEIRKPLFLHQRDAHRRLLEILDAHKDTLPPAVVHCFTDGTNEVKDCLDRGFHIGITGWICDERRGTHLREVVRLIPSERLMIETDAPYLLPRNIRPRPATRRNEPMYLPYVLQAVAEAAGKPVEQVAEETTSTARKFFGIG